MPAKNLLRVPQKGTYLHIYNKGIENRAIFCDDQDFRVFLSYLHDYLTKPADVEVRKQNFVVKGKTFKGIPHQTKNYFDQVELLAYSLMPEHFHLVLHQSTEGALERFIRSLCTRYSIYFNKKYQRQGALFAGPYKSAHLQNTVVLLHLVTYLHKFHGENNHSSEAEYLSQRETPWVKQSILLHIYANAENKPAGARDSYKEFAEKYTFDNKEKQLLQGVLIEEPLPALERRVLYRDLSSNSIKSPANNFKANKQTARLPEYFALSFVFISLLGLGIKNVNHSSNTSPTSNWFSAKSSGKFFNPEVISPIQDPSTSDRSVVLSASTSATLSPTQPNSIPYSPVVIKEGVGEVNFYQEQSTDSAILITAHAGDRFEARPLDSEWSEVKLSQNAVGFILSKHLNLEQPNN